MPIYKPIRTDTAMTITVSLTSSSLDGHMTFRSSTWTSLKNVIGEPAKLGIIGLGISTIRRKYIREDLTCKDNLVIIDVTDKYEKELS
ncbi:hypothetical protein A2Y99_01840 [Candidatus Gottesmanbacteria bacterium RBG_13_37_7]|uniref:Uncharacterized protein n=1 Tax=Candidatus Gottesmanbacteria bacterium RBG_13_37_7 TaxID=1798369 RepID=A0A1F5YKA0_9BACT|nr:MAG: hypothetical protein A2Y99_01840 [Candidatus Gottesmanbacteria bacterium RBG_13_37_7]